MASTYTTNTGIEKPEIGAQDGTWGATVNTNFDLIDESTNGVISNTLSIIGTSGSPNNLPITDGTSSNGRNKFIELVDGGDLGGTAFLQFTPNNAEKVVHIRNSLSGSRSVNIFQGTYNASNDYTLANGKDAVLKFNGAGSGAVVSQVFVDLDATAIAGITATNLLDKSAAEAVTGQFTFTAPILGTPASGVATNLTGTAAGLTVGNVTIADESSDTTCFPLFTTAATGDLPPKSGSNLTFNSSTGILGATTFSGAGTSLTGTGASFTAGTVTTNANLTGPITSSGNATSVAAQTGSGSVFVMNTSPALVTPALGTPASGVATNITGLPAASVVAGSLGAGAYTITNSSSGALTTGMLLTNATATSANTSIALYLAPNAAATARAASIVSEQTTSGNYADLTFNVANGDTPFEAMSIATTGNITIPAGDLHFASGKDIIFDADGTTDVGKTGARAANVWSDLVNGADYGFENGWRALESDTYAGYSTGIAFDFGEHFEDGKALAVNKVLTGQKIKSGRQIPTGTKIATGFQEEVDGKLVDIFDDEMVDEMIEETVRERVTNISKIPTFVVTNDFIEFKGRRITASDLDKLLALI